MPARSYTAVSMTDVAILNKRLKRTLVALRKCKAALLRWHSDEKQLTTRGLTDTHVSKTKRESRTAIRVANNCLNQED